MFKLMDIQDRNKHTCDGCGTIHTKYKVTAGSYTRYACNICVISVDRKTTQLSLLDDLHMEQIEQM